MAELLSSSSKTRWDELDGYMQLLQLNVRTNAPREILEVKAPHVGETQVAEGKQDPNIESESLEVDKLHETLLLQQDPAMADSEDHLKEETSSVACPHYSVSLGTVSQEYANQPEQSSKISVGTSARMERFKSAPLTTNRHMEILAEDDDEFPAFISKS